MSQRATLGSVADFVNGYGFNEGVWAASGRPIIRIQNLTDQSKPFNYTEYDPGKRFHVVEGDILVSWSATLDVFVWRGPDAYLNQHIFKVLPDYTRVDKSYLIHALRNAIASMSSVTRGSTMKHVNRGDFLNTEIFLPSLDAQQRIAAILDKADSLRCKRQEAIRLVDDFQCASFFHSFGDAEANVMGWPVFRLEDVALQVTDGEHQTPQRSHKGVHLLSARNIQNGYLDFGDVDYVPLEEFERIRRRCEPRRGDILISCSGSIGRVAQVTVDEPMALVRSVALVRPNKEMIRSSFLEHLLRSVPMQRRMIAASKSSAQANLFQGPIRALPIMLPPIEVQIQFEQIVAHVASLSVKFEGAMADVVDLASSLQWQYFNKASCS